MAVLKNQYGEIVTNLVPDGFGYYRLPEGFDMDCLAIGDTYSVESEDEEE